MKTPDFFRDPFKRGMLLMLIANVLLFVWVLTLPPHRHPDVPRRDSAGPVACLLLAYGGALMGYAMAKL